MGTKIRERREFLKMTQEELAEKSGISRVTISALESDSQRNVSSKTMIAIAKALDTTVEKLFFDQSV